MNVDKYHTLLQFINVSILMMEIIIFTINAVILYYKLQTNRLFYTLMTMELSIILLSLFFSEVLLDNRLYQQIFSFAMITYILTFAVLFIQSHYSFLRKFFAFCLVLLCMLSLKVIGMTWFLLLPLFALISYLIIFHYPLENIFSYDILPAVKDLVFDKVLIVDITGQIIFASKSFIDSSVFSIDNKLDLEQMTSFFNSPILLRERYNTKYIKVLSDNAKYFRYSKKSIMNNNKVEAYIYTFVEVTELFEKLFALEEQKEELRKTNLMLSRYKDKVYFVQSQKEITVLLEKIAETQIKSVHEISKSLQILNLESENSKSELEQILTTSKIALAEVRKAVSTYKN